MKIFAKTLTTILLLASIPGFCHEKSESVLPLFIQEKVVDGKYYIAPGTAFVAPDGIFIYMENELFHVLALHSDSKGVYVNTSDLLTAKGSNRAYWMCRRCTAYNPPNRTTCRNGCEDWDEPPRY